MLDEGAIWPSQSLWCNTVILVWKKDGTLRFCIDFRHLNACTKKDSYLIPKCLETMESLVGAHYFSTMDLKNGFWQVKVSEDSCPIHSIYGWQYGCEQIFAHAILPL